MKQLIFLAVIFLAYTQAASQSSWWLCNYTIHSNFTCANMYGIRLNVSNPMPYINYTGFNNNTTTYSVSKSAGIITINNPCGPAGVCTVGAKYSISFALNYTDNSLICWPFMLSQTGLNNLGYPISSCVPQVTWASGSYVSVVGFLACVLLFAL